MKRKIVPSILVLFFGVVSFVMPVSTATTALAGESIISTKSDTVIPRPDKPESNGTRIIIPDTPNVSYSYLQEGANPKVYDISDGEKIAIIPRDQKFVLRAMPETGYRFQQGDSDELSEQWTYEYDDSDLETIPKPNAPNRSKNTVKVPESEEVAYFYLGVNKNGQSLEPTAVEHDGREMNIPSEGSIHIRAFPQKDYKFENRDEPFTWEYKYDTAFDAPAVVIERETDFTWVWVIAALAGAGILVPVALVNIRDKRDSIQSRQKAQEDRTRQLERLMQRYDVTRSKVMKYKMDINLAISYPAMNDLAEKKTQEMTIALKHAEALHENVEQRQRTVSANQLADYRSAVIEFENTLEVAEDNAKRIMTSNMSEEDQKDFTLASQLLSHASDKGTPEKLRENYTAQLKKVIDRINARRNVVIPTEAVSGIEKVVRFEIEG